MRIRPHQIAGPALPAAALLTGCVAPIIPPPGLVSPAPPVAVMSEARAEAGASYGPLRIWDLSSGDEPLPGDPAAALGGRYTLLPESLPELAVEVGLQQSTLLSPLQHSFVSTAATAWFRPDGAADRGLRVAFGSGLLLGLGDTFGYAPSMPSAGIEGDVQLAYGWSQSALSATLTSGYATPLREFVAEVSVPSITDEGSTETLVITSEPIQYAGLDLRCDRRPEDRALGSYAGLGAVLWFDPAAFGLRGMGYLHASAGLSW